MRFSAPPPSRSLLPPLRRRPRTAARLANLLKLTAGADASIDHVKLDIKGVQATATLVVRLDNVRAIIERTLQTLDNNPQLVSQLLSTVDNTVNTVGGVANNTVGTVADGERRRPDGSPGHRPERQRDRGGDRRGEPDRLVSPGDALAAE
jgi:hypothetical protein